MVRPDVMTRHLVLAGLTLLVAAWGGGCGMQGGESGAGAAGAQVAGLVESDHPMLTESPAARAHLADLRQRFRVSAREPELGNALHRLSAGAPSEPALVIGAGVVDAFEPTVGGRVRVVVGERTRRGATKPARVELPARASEPVRLTDESSGMAIDFALEGAGEAGLAVADGIAMYEAALPNGADVLHRAGAEGTEDFVVFSSKPDREELTYRVDVSQVAGLRLVANTLELLDGEGTPRLRVAPPYAVDATGVRHEARVGVSGCAYDTDARGPWGRAVTAPGARQCGVRVTWGEVAYPAVVDPAWMATGSMATPRLWHPATRLLNGKVLVAGGYGGVGFPYGYLASAELYDPPTGTWASAGSMSVARSFDAATVLPNGKVLVTGGTDGFGLNNADLYDPSAGTWSPATPMNSAHVFHTQTALANGKVLVVGFGVPSEVYDPSANTWTLGGPGIGTRYDHAAALLPSGKVLVVGGNDVLSGITASTALYDPSTNAWTAGAPMSTPRTDHAMVALADGRVLVVGGYDSASLPTASAEIYDPSVNAWTNVGPMTNARSHHTATSLLDGQVLVVGGISSNISLASAELFHPSTNAWTMVESMTISRRDHTTTRLTDGTVLVAGGQGGVGSPALASSELHVSGCAADSADCDGNGANGCESSLSTTTNCGACGKACPAAMACVNHTCALGACNAGTHDCDGQVQNGCESSFPCAGGAHCTQGSDCAGRTCSNGLCQSLPGWICAKGCWSQDTACGNAAGVVLNACIPACQNDVACLDACGSAYQASMAQCAAVAQVCVGICYGSCLDGVQDDGETGVDCGGPCGVGCP